MANLRVFVSSTAYDLSVLRSAVRSFVAGLGYEPVLSDYSDVLYDPKEHTHKSCLSEISSCDMVVLVIGSRFGSPIDSAVLSSSIHDIDVSRITDGDPDLVLSVTQAEALVALSRQIPVFAFVDRSVYSDYSVYQRNKGQPFAASIAYPSISQPETAEYIFRFIDFLQGRSFNNALIPFDRLEDLIDHLRKQWAALFQRLMYESREQVEDAMRIDRLADQFEDLKTALLATVGDSGSRNVARAVIRFRRLLDFLRSLPNPGAPLKEEFAKAEVPFWELLLRTADIAGFHDLRQDRHRSTPWHLILFTTEGESFGARVPRVMLDRFERDWQSLRGMTPSEREVIFDAIAETEDSRLGITLVRRLTNEDLEELNAAKVWEGADEVIPSEAAAPIALEPGAGASPMPPPSLEEAK